MIGLFRAHTHLKHVKKQLIQNSTVIFKPRGGVDIKKRDSMIKE